ncbi:Dihydroorotate dehydrogenase (quinone), mitochondrial, partial [Ascosphaera atra]
VFGYNITNPIGISAGLDKDADIPDPLFEAGAGIVEVGGITPLPQPGNAKPRVFRIPSQQAIINRYGLNSKGADAVAVTLQKRVQDFARKEGFGRGAYAEKQVLDGAAGVPPGSLTDGKLLAIQIAKNKVTPNDDIDAIKRDYVYCVERLGKYADILVVNVSSPNTPGLRDLQATEPLTKILSGVVNAARSTERRTKPFVMVKVSPDEDSKEQMAGVCAAVWASGVDGVIVANATQKRPVWENQKLSKQEQEVLKETGGFSGPHLAKHTIDLVGRYRRMLDQPINDGIIKPRDGPQEEANQNEGGVLKKLPQLPDAATWDKNSRKVIFASGGMTTGKDVIEAQKAGATAAMLYTGMVYTGPGTITRMKNEMRGIKESEDRMKKLPQ